MTSRSNELTLEWLPGRYAVCRLDADAAFPSWAQAGQGTSLLSITRTDRELSIVIDESCLPLQIAESVKIERGFLAIRVVGILDFSQIGILATLTGALAKASVPVFAISTFETDVLLVSAAHAAAAQKALQTVAHVPSRE